jgi:hypothetical protein
MIYSFTPLLVFPVGLNETSDSKRRREHQQTPVLKLHCVTFFPLFFLKKKVEQKIQAGSKESVFVIVHFLTRSGIGTPDYAQIILTLTLRFQLEILSRCVLVLQSIKKSVCFYQDGTRRRCAPVSVRFRLC